MFVCSVASRLLQVGQNFIPSSVPSTFAPSPTPAPQAVSSGLNDLFELSTGMAITTGGYVVPKAVSSRSGTPPPRSARVGNFSRVLCRQVWLPAVKAKGLEISGTFSRRQGHMYMDMTFTNKALQHMTDFAVQFNKNRWVARRFSDSHHLSAQLQAFSRLLLVCVCVVSVVQLRHDSHQPSAHSHSADAQSEHRRLAAHQHHRPRHENGSAQQPAGD